MKAVVLLINEGKNVIIFSMKNIFSRFRTPRVIISDGVLYFLMSIQSLS